MWVFGQYSECPRSTRFDGGAGQSGSLKEGKEALLKLTDSGRNPVSQ